MNPVVSILNGALTVLVVLLVGSAGLFYYLKTQFDKPGPLPRAATFVIPKGDGANVIAERLERDGIISDRRIFMASVLYFKYLKSRAHLKAGEYEFRKDASMRTVLDAISEGKSMLHKFTLPEGLTSEQVVLRLNAAPELEGTISQAPAEGSLLPDTYKYSRGTSRQEILDRMQAEQEKFVMGLWPERDQGLPVKTPQEALILASIVEKETGRTDERSRVASVFVNRLRTKMRLQSDPTIIYGIVGGKGPLGRPITQEEITQATPYNTYAIDGLPPTPIGNPGRASIEAVLNPAVTKDLYFVADGTGGHAFAASLQEHQRNVSRWREVERQQREAAAQAAAEAEKPGGPDAPSLVITNVPGLNNSALLKKQQQQQEQTAETPPDAAPPEPPADAAPTSPATEAMADPNMPVPTRKPEDTDAPAQAAAKPAAKPAPAKAAAKPAAPKAAPKAAAKTAPAKTVKAAPTKAAAKASPPKTAAKPGAKPAAKSDKPSKTTEASR